MFHLRELFHRRLVPLDLRLAVEHEFMFEFADVLDGEAHRLPLADLDARRREDHLAVFGFLHRHAHGLRRLPGVARFSDRHGLVTAGMGATGQQR
ncbi:hypothetical protein D9M70_621970 [compost metagenome]